MTSTIEERPAGAPPSVPADRNHEGTHPVTLGERLRKVGSVLLAFALALPVGAVIHRFSGELEVDRGVWTTLGIAVVGTSVVTFCVPRWRRFPYRPSRPGDWPRTLVQKAMAVVLMVILFVVIVFIGYLRLAD